MSNLRVRAEAPSNIAIVKYMGKTDHSANLALNPSLSMTLANFRSTVEISALDSGPDRWEPLPGVDLPLKAGERFLRFLAERKRLENISGSFLVRSGNNFPSDCGLASSASSFAALTLAIEKAFAASANRPERSALELARISRTGSGSSCRSFFSPWCAWEGDLIAPVHSQMPELVDLVVVLASEVKKVSSSEAHRRVQSSPLMDGRAERATARQERVKRALSTADYHSLFVEAWAELWEMHSLFHTANPPFRYFTPQSLATLDWVENQWERQGNGPIATVDAGPNIHLLVRKEEAQAWLERLQRELAFPATILSSGA